MKSGFNRNPKIQIVRERKSGQYLTIKNYCGK